ncbi:sulfoacetaldehyde dehydrogenase [Dichotomicrobium thermohalophilum]|uniref:Sulfoacetaldehyde dehydrogenase n=2 Tax=Dichotomicrobium thermohalophilum TaxID=933063 RepID=A0A397P6Z9_9HYPH|nr:sulfoacetaldehyde dehydrogenase [Dichotomicrobium thermohalophilum]
MTAQTALHQTDTTSEEIRAVDETVARARAAQARFSAKPTQARYDRAALAVGWAIMEPARNREMAELAVATTGLGNVEDKVAKNHRKTLGLLRDIREAKSCGIVREVPELGLTEIARPVGVVGAVTPSTNPVATPANNIINALKCGNAIILSPSPAGAQACERLIGYIHAEFAKIGEDPDLVQMVPAPPSKVKTQRLMETVDLIIVTGSQDNVRRAYTSGTPAIGVGTGNATVIVDETADIEEAAKRIAASKTFDYATSCSSENAVIVLDAVRDAFLKAAYAAGGRLLDAAQTQKVKEALWQNGKLSREMIAKDAATVMRVAGIEVPEPETARFFLAPADAIGPEEPLSGEKLSLITALYTARDFADAKDKAWRILLHQGAGHSVGLHSTRDDRAVELGQDLPTTRVILNQPHCFATGGSFENGLHFSLSMGCGTWGGNSIDDNLHYRHFLNITKVARPIPPRAPTVDEIFADYWAEAGK